MNSTQHKQNWFERNPGKTLAIFILFIFFAVDFGAAAILKTMGLFTPSGTSASVREAYYRKRHTVYHHSLAPNIDYGQAEWGGRSFNVKTNSLGFKDGRVRGITQRPVYRRIVFIGDSFTEGMGVEYPETFVGLIDARLAANNIEVLNAAASSYAPIIYFRKIEYLINTLGVQFNKLVVFIDLSDMEDESKVYTFDKKHNVIIRKDFNEYYSDVIQTTTEDRAQQPGTMSFQDFLAQYTVITGRLRNLGKYLNTRTRSWKKSLNRRRSLWTVDENLYNSYGKQGLELAALHMTKLKDLLDRHAVPLTIVIYPWPDQIWHRDLHSKQVTFWQDWANRHKVEMINLFPEFINDREDAEATIKKYFINGDVHWNSEGHRKVANAILPLL